MNHRCMTIARPTKLPKPFLLFFPHPFWDRLEDESEINNLSSHTPLFLCCTILLPTILCYYITDTI